MIVGATPDSDYQIMSLSAALYKKYELKRVFYSAYIPVVENPLLPAKTTEPPLLREHRLYQADWLLRYYGFDANELLDEKHPFLNQMCIRDSCRRRSKKSSTRDAADSSASSCKIISAVPEV